MSPERSFQLPDTSPGPISGKNTISKNTTYLTYKTEYKDRLRYQFHCHIWTEVLFRNSVHFGSVDKQMVTSRKRYTDGPFMWYISAKKFLHLSPRVGSGVVRIDPLHFLAGCRTRRLNQALSVLSLSLGSFLVCVLCC